MEKIFKSITPNDLISILGQTIKRDEINKLITFLAMLSVYTEDSQINISFNAPSSSGKSFIPLEIAQLFPKEDVVKLGSASPTAFYHEQGTYDKERNSITVDLSRKIVIFLDQPGSQLLGKLRSLLSHDEKEIIAKITDKNQKGGNRTKTVIIKGFPVVVFCTAGLTIDEQEATRFLLLSPDISQEKLRESITEKILKESAVSLYRERTETEPLRAELVERIQAIKAMQITEIRIGSKASHKVNDMFFQRTKMLKPRNQRDIGRILNLIKVFALLNVWDKTRIDNIVYADDSDVNYAFDLWDQVCESQELNLPPFVYSLYQDVIVPIYEEKNTATDSQKLGVKVGITRQQILEKHFSVYGRFLPEIQLRQQILPMLKTTGLISEEPDEFDKRRMLIYPTLLHTISPQKNNSVEQSGVISLNKEENVSGEVSTANDHASISPCFVCSSTKFWKTHDGAINCFTCHPPSSEENVKEWITA